MSQRLGTPVVRKEDPALLSGRGRYADDLPVPAGTLHAHVIRSPHPHADIVRIDAAEALAHGWRLGGASPARTSRRSPIRSWSR